MIDPKETRALRLLARAHALDGHLEDAQNLYEALAEAIPDDAEAHLHLGYLHALQDRGVEAGEQFRAAFQTDFDYLLNDFVPFFVAMREAMSHDVAQDGPPRVVKFRGPPPKVVWLRVGNVSTDAIHELLGASVDVLEAFARTEEEALLVLDGNRPARNG